MKNLLTSRFWTPLLISALHSMFCLCYVGGWFQTDTAMALTETRALGDPAKVFHIIPTGFTLLLDGLMAIFPPEHRMIAFVVMSHAALLVSVFLVGWICRLAGHPRAAFWASLFLSLCFPLYLQAQMSGSEIPYLFLALLGTTLGLLAWKKKHPLLFLLPGLVLGPAISIRTVGIAIPLVFLIAFLLSKARPTPLAFLCFVVGVVFGVAPFSLLNKSRYGDFQLVEGRGLHLFNKVGVAEMPLGQGSASDEIRDLATRHGIDLSGKDKGWVLQETFTTQDGRSPEEADQLLRSAAIETFVDHPVMLAQNSLEGMFVITGETNPWYGIFGQGASAENFSHYHETVSEVWGGNAHYFRQMQDAFPAWEAPGGSPGWVHSFLQYYPVSKMCQLWRGPWTVLAMIGFCLLGLFRRNFPILLLSGAALAHALVPSLTEGPLPRFWQVGIPFLILSVCVVVSSWVQHREARVAKLEGGSKVLQP